MDLVRQSIEHKISFLTGFYFLSLFGLVLPSCSLTSGESSPLKHSRSESNFTFPAEIALAAYGKANQNKDQPVLNKELQIDSALQCLLGKNDFSEATASDDAMLKTAFEKATEQVIDSDDRAEVAKAIQLVKTGQFYQDIVSATKVSIGLIPQIRNSIGPELLRPSTVRCPVSSVVNGIKGIVGNPDLRDIVDNPIALEALLRCIYEQEGPKAVAQTAGVLLQNDSVQLAVIAYARANGIDLNESDLDTLRETVLNTDDPNLDPLVEAGIARLKEEYGVDEFEPVIQRMEGSQVDCNQ